VPRAPAAVAGRLEKLAGLFRRGCFHPRMGTDKHRLGKDIEREDGKNEQRDAIARIGARLKGTRKWTGGGTCRASAEKKDHFERAGTGETEGTSHGDAERHREGKAGRSEPRVEPQHPHGIQTERPSLRALPLKNSGARERPKARLPVGDP